MLGTAAIAQVEVQVPYSTHDWTVSVAGEGGQFNEAWADVKSPGDGFQYAVGTIEVRDTGPGALFSGVSAIPAAPLTGFLLSAPNRRQVVILQITRTVDQGIDQQRYYYGITGPGTVLDRASNARGISVWPALERTDTRIAICGETYDQSLPLSQASFGAATANAPTGFIAVFDGLGTLLWTQHVFGVDPAQSCAITDVSIRVEGGTDVVTYCGISSHGVPTSATPLSPVGTLASYLGDSGGATHQGTGQWDGIVGRVTHTAAGVQTVVFHSIVGGPEQDGLFGIAEIDANRVAVVGGTRWSASTAPPAGFAFPGLGSLSGPFAVGVALIFDLSSSPGQLESALPIGSTGEFDTLARDVLVLRDAAAQVDGSGFAAPGLPCLVVVGSTNDPGIFAAIGQPPVPAMQGPTDGFVIDLLDFPGFPTPILGRYHGGSGNDGLTGVQGWNEYADHVVVTGFTENLGADGFGPLGNLDISVESYYLSTDAVGPFLPSAIRSLRRSQIGGSSVDRPAAMGVVQAMTAGLAYDTGPLGEPAGGGIAVDERSRVNVVGQTLSSDYYRVGGGRAFDAGRDAVRTVFDMIPPGVGRTDGTGVQGAFVLPAGFTGGTTPPCALAPFGKLIGGVTPAVPRMLIEYEGAQPAAGVTGAAILAIRPTAPILAGAWISSVTLAGFQFDFPGVSAPAIQLVPEGVELFITGSSVFTSAVFAYPNQSMLLPLLQLPTPPSVGIPMTVQVFCAIPALVPGGVGATCTTTSLFTATPAMWLPL